MARGNQKAGQRSSLSAIQGMTVRTTQAPSFVGFDMDTGPLKTSKVQEVNRDLYREQSGEPGDMPERTPRLMPERYLNDDPKASLKDILIPGDLFSLRGPGGSQPYRVLRSSGRSFVGVSKDGEQTKFVGDKTADGRIWRFTDRSDPGSTVLFGVSRRF